MPVQDQPSISSVNNQSQSQPESILADEVSPDNIVTDLSKPSLEELEDQLKSVPHQPLIQPVTEVTVTEDQIKIEEQTIEVETVGKALVTSYYPEDAFIDFDTFQRTR